MRTPTYTYEKPLAKQRTEKLELVKFISVGFELGTVTEMLALVEFISVGFELGTVTSRPKPGVLSSKVR